VHIVWAFALLADISATNTTPLHLLYILIPNRFILSTALFVSSLAAVIAIRRDVNDGNNHLLLTGQFVFLLLSSSGSFVAIATSQFADGVVRPIAFMTADRIVEISLALSYTLSRLDGIWKRK
jgi:hypothetical protein